MAIEEDNPEDERSDTKQRTKPTVILAFGVIGFLIDFFFAINLSASQDILEATEIRTSLVLLSASVPAGLATIMFTYFVQRISVSVVSCGMLIFSVTGMLLTALVQDPKMKLIGVCLTSFGYGSLDAVFFPLTSGFGIITVRIFALGSGISYLAAPLFYMGKFIIFYYC